MAITRITRTGSTLASYPLLATVFVACLAFPTNGRGDGGVEFFEAKIRPALVKHCYECHAGDPKSIKGGLRLDSRAAMRRGGESGPAIQPGKPADSLLLSAMRHDELEMPPDGRLAPAIVADFEKWILLGAPDPRVESAKPVKPRSVDIEQGRRYWAFRPLQTPRTPTTAAGARHWIDGYVQARLSAQGLPVPREANSATLTRRVHYDLTGLPPTADQLQRFLSDASPDAFERLVDRLLASPRFGERWGRHWLDVARYADSNGGDFNATFHNAWRYRNYVIDVFNEDLSFFEFVRRQVAGDLLPYDSVEQRERQLVATGLLMLGPKMLSERDKSKLQMDVVDEQIDSLGRAFLAMTLGCARCHDHKYDPIPSTDYYALAGFFQSTQTLDGEIQKYVSNWVREPLPVPPEVEVAAADFAERIAVQQRQVDGVKAQIKQHDGAVQSLLKEGVVVDNRDAKVVGVWKNSTFSPQFVGAEYIHDEKKGKGDKRVTFTADLPAPGEYEVRISYTAGNGRAKKVPLRIEHADGSADVFVDQTAAPELANLFHVVGRYRFASRATVTLSNAGTTGHVIADAVQFVSTEKGRDKSANDDDGVELAALRGRLVELEKQLAGLKKEAPQKPRALAVRDAKQIADCELRIRGEHGNRGAVVPRGFLQVIPIGAQPSFGASESGRRELADWLADHRNPLTSRVFANRVWARLMGRGVVPSVDNFGTLGQTPTHPQLLDALAGELISADGSVKRLVREIVCSRAYRSSSADVAAARRIDPENELLWRAHRKRLEAEAIRDAMLLVSGQLDETRAASPVEHLGVLVTTNRPDAENYQQKSSTRRTVFLPIIRNELPAMLTAFDFADPDFSTGQRAATSTPTQSLLLLNSPFVKQCAAATASRWAERGHDLDRIYLTLLSRHPLPDERAATREFIKGETAHGVQVDVAWRRLIHAIIASAEFRILE